MESTFRSAVVAAKEKGYETGGFDIMKKFYKEHKGEKPKQPATTAGKKKAPAKEKSVSVKPHVLRELGIKYKDLPDSKQIRHVQKDVPHIVREKGKATVKKSA